MIKLSIRRPVAVAMTYLALAALGVTAWLNIPIELLPEAQFPRITINASWAGASPETVEAFLTSPLESQVQQLKGVESLNSTSSAGSTRLDMEFSPDTDMDFVRLELSERLAALEDELPPGVTNIRVIPYVPREFAQQASTAILTYRFTGPYTIEALRAHVDEIIQPALSQVNGVSAVTVNGGRERLLRVELNRDQMEALGLTSARVGQRLQDLDLVQEAGVVREGDLEWAITVRNRPATAEDVRSTVIASDRGRLVLLGDVGTVSDTYEEPRNYFRINGNPAVNFTVQREDRSNTVEVAAEAREVLDNLQERNPPGAVYTLERDQSVEIDEQLNDLRNRAIFSGVVIFLVLLGFLRSWRSTLVIFTTIAFSILIGLNLIYFGGLTLNLLTLMGLALGFGLIVDNSIVVLENIYRRWQNGEDPKVAAEEGPRQVVLPIMAATLTTLIVFVPFVYFQGELRIYYLPLAIVVACTLFASIFVAFTFIPALASRLLATGTRKGDYSVSMAHVEGSADSSGGGSGGDGQGPSDRSGEGGAFGAIGSSPMGKGGKPPMYIRAYSSVISFNLRHPWITIIVAVLCLYGSYYMFENNVTRSRWRGNSGGSQRSYITISIDLPSGSDLARVNQLTEYFEINLAQIPEVSSFQANVSENGGDITVYFPDSLENTAVPQAINDQLYAYSLSFSGADVRVRGMGQSFYGSSGSTAPNYTIQILGYNYLEVQRIAEDLGRRLSVNSRIYEVNTNAGSGRGSREKESEYVLAIDRDAIARFGMTAQELSSEVNALARGETTGTNVMLDDEEVALELKMSGFRELDVLGLMESMIRLADGRSVRLGDVVTMSSQEVLANIRRQDQQYERSIQYEFRGPTKLGDKVRDDVIVSTVLPPGYTIVDNSEFSFSRDDEKQIWTVLLVAVLLIYMVTAALFESVRAPLAVLLTVPMALIGVFLMFYWTKLTFTGEAWIGVIMMGGIVVNNAILLVDHVNQTRREHPELSFEDQILQGTLERVRPILMTTATTVFGLLPLVITNDGSGDSRIWTALGYSLIGGLLSSTIFVLTTTPSIYFLIERVGRVVKVPKGELARVRAAGGEFTEAPATG